MRYKLLLLCLFFVFVSNAQNYEQIPFEDAYKRAYNVLKLTGNQPVIDGRLDDYVWLNQGEWSETFVQVSPYERRPTNSPTRAKIFYDDKYLYVGIYCKDAEPEKMNRFIDNRDANNVGELVSIAFDTYHDFRAAPEFNLNLGGNKTDLVVTDQLTANRSWNAVWDAKTHVNLPDSSWTAEIRIPFSQLRYNQDSEDGVWGLHIRRIIRRNSETQNWSLIPLKNNGHVFSFGELHGMTDLPKPRGIEILPYTMGKYKNEPEIPGSPYQKGNSWGGNVGLDAKFALSDFTLDVTVNPDFGQVELDPSVMNLTAYETFYDEKRPFFLEGKHIMDFNNGSDMMFYTRRIGSKPSYSPKGIDNETSFAATSENVPIIGALKLTGTNKRGVTLGLVQSITARSSLKVTRDGAEAKEVVEPLTNYTVARVQKNWKGNTLLGGMVTSVNRVFDDQVHLENMLVQNAYTAGIDFTQYFANRLYYIEGKGMLSHLTGSEEAITALQQSSTHYYQRTTSDYLGVDPNRTSLTGTGGYLKIGRKGNAKWTFSEAFNWASPGFDLNTVGYMKEADYISNETEIAFKQTNTWKIFRNNTFTLKQTNKWDYGGRSIHNTLNFNWKTMFLNRFEINFTENYGWNFIGTRKLYGGPALRVSPFLVSTINVNTDKSKRVVLSAKYVNDYCTSGNQYHTITPKVSLRLGNHLLISGEFNYDTKKEHMQYVATIPSGTTNIPFSSNDYVMGRMDQETYGLTLKVQMNVTPDISIQFYGSPYTSTAKYSEFKHATNTLAWNHEERFHQFANSEISGPTNGVYAVNWGDKDYQFKDPNFSFNEFRSNLVARWEYKPGSTLYLVWEHTMSNRDKQVISGWGNNLDRMFGLPASNVFMVKLNYWISL
ncbi:carbohydrate binding family 9 domain-containing protein [Parabacteroides sp. OttesenSCG-928-G21]|nr:carbohydrate binding family 9 domain-containing protein [Parabacteroides sp. OttesenSCG-928-G21]